VSRSTRHGEPLSLALIDLDDFQLVNNLHGHSHGDRILAALAQCLESHRLEDRRFRLGGDEFALSSPAVSLPDALIILERLRARAESLLFGATLSIGVATMDLDDSAMDAETLREQADAALYEAKRRGRNTVVSFDEIKGRSKLCRQPTSTPYAGCWRSAASRSRSSPSGTSTERSFSAAMG
jgi:two-component system cell cycle response regulator